MAVAANVIGVVITSSPGPRASDGRPVERRGPRAERDGVAGTGRGRERLLEGRHPRARSSASRSAAPRRPRRRRRRRCPGGRRAGASRGRARPPSIASRSPSRREPTLRHPLGPGSQPLGHPGARRRRGPRRGATSGRQPSSSAGQRGRRSAGPRSRSAGGCASTCTMRVGSGSTTAASSLTDTSTPGPGVEDPPVAASETQRVAHEAGAVLGVQQVARLGPVAVDAQLLADQRAPREDGHDPALADRALERPVRVERPDDGRRQPVGVVVESVSASPASFEAAYGDAGLVGWSSSIPSGRRPGRRPCTCS